MLDGGIDGLDTGLLGSMKNNLGKMGEDLIGEVNADNLALGAASLLVEKLGVADMISSNNCYIKDLMSGAIGSPKLMESLPASLEEKFGPELNVEQLAAVKQVEEISIEEIKKAGVHSPALAGMAGSNVVKSTEKIKEVWKRPIFSGPPPIHAMPVFGRPYETLLMAKNAILFPQGTTRPLWDENIINAEGKPGAYIKWWGHKTGGTRFVRQVDGVTITTHEGQRSFVLQILMWNHKLHDWVAKKIRKDTKLFSGLIISTFHTDDITKDLNNIMGDIELADGYFFESDDNDNSTPLKMKLYNPVL